MIFVCNSNDATTREALIFSISMELLPKPATQFVGAYFGNRLWYFRNYKKIRWDYQKKVP